MRAGLLAELIEKAKSLGITLPVSGMSDGRFMDPDMLDPILIAAGFEVSSPSTQAFGLGLPAPTTLIFDPTATRAENTYTTWAQIVQCAATFAGPVNVYIPKNVTIPNGAYTMPANWTLLLGAGITLTLAATATFSTFPSKTIGAIDATSGAASTITGLTTTTAHFVASAKVSSCLYNVHIHMGGTGPLFSTAFDALFAFYGVSVDTTAGPVFVQTAGTQITFYGQEITTIQADTISTTGNLVIFFDSTTNIDPAQTVTGTTTDTSISTAPFVGYSPTNPSDWVIPVPQSVQDALDELATRTTTEVVFQPNGVAGGNVFTSWSDLVSFLSATQIATIYLDSSLSLTTGQCDIPAGSWVMPFETNFVSIVDFTSGTFAIMNLINGANLISTNALSFTNVHITFNSTITPPFSGITNGCSLLFEGDCSLAYTGGGSATPLMSYTGSQVYVEIAGTSHISTVGGGGAIGFSGSSVSILVKDAAIVDGGAIGIGSGSMAISVVAGAKLDESYWSLALTTVLFDQGAEQVVTTFSPGGTSNAPEVFTDWGNLIGYLNQQNNHIPVKGCSIIFDGFFVGATITIPAGTYNLPITTTMLAAADPGLHSLAPWPTVDFAVGTTITGWRRITIDQITVSWNNTAAPVTTIATDSASLTLTGDGSLFSIGAPSKVFLALTNTCELSLTMRDFSYIGNLSTSIDSTSQIVGTMAENAFIDASSVSITAGGNFQVYVNSVAGNNIDSSYTANTTIMAGGMFTSLTVANPEGAVHGFTGALYSYQPNASTPAKLWYKTEESSLVGGWALLSQSGTATLTNGVTGTISAFLTATSRIVVTRKDALTSTTLGELTCKSSDRVTGTPGTFKVTSLILGTPASIQTADQSSLDWFVVDNKT